MKLEEIKERLMDSESFRKEYKKMYLYFKFKGMCLSIRLFIKKLFKKNK